MARNPWAYWSVAVALALATAITVSELTASARQLRATYGSTATVIMTTVDVEAGTPLVEHTEAEEVPVGLVPDAAVTTIDPDDRAAGPISARSIVTDAHLRLPSLPAPGRAAVAVPRSPTTPPVTPGDVVLLVVNADPFSGLEGGVVRGEALVATDDQVVLAIAVDELVTVATALGGAGVTLALGG